MDPATLSTVTITAPVAADYTDAVSGAVVTGLSLDPTTGLVTGAAGHLRVGCFMGRILRRR